MATVIRLTRFGRRHLPYYRIGVFDTRTRRDGRPIEDLGRYDPLSKEKEVILDVDRAKHWLETGAETSETVTSILKAQGLGSLLVKTRKKAGKPKVSTAAKKAEKAKARKVKKRSKGRTSKSMKTEKTSA